MVLLSTTRSARMLVILVLIALSLRATSLDSPHFVSDSCHDDNSDNSGLVFQANLKDTLLNKLLPNATKLDFYNSTSGNGTDKVYALYYCTGDVDAQTCQECVQAATAKIIDACEFRKEGIVWFEECTLRFADRAIYSIDEETPNYPYYNRTGMMNDFLLGPYEDTFRTTMAALIQEAANGNGTVPGFATDEITISSTQTLRGLAQCTPDIIGSKCYKCLTTALRLRDTWANTMIFLPSCLFKYDLYGTTLTTSSPPSPRAPHTPPPSKKSLYVIGIFSPDSLFSDLSLCATILKAKVADFGLTKIFPATDVTSIETRVIGTHGYTAPEKTIQRKFHRRTDAGEVFRRDIATFVTNYGEYDG